MVSTMKFIVYISSFHVITLYPLNLAGREIYCLKLALTMSRL